MTIIRDATQSFLFTVAIICISRGLLARDRLMGRVGNRLTRTPSGVPIFQACHLLGGHRVTADAACVSSDTIF
jgi:hypothetical protein